MKKLTAIVLAMLALVLVLAACGGGGDEETTATTVEQTTAPEITTAAPVITQLDLATINEDGDVELIFAEGETSRILTNSMGESVLLTDDTDLEAVKDAAGTVTGVKTDKGDIIGVTVGANNILTVTVTDGFAPVTVAVIAEATTEKDETTTEEKDDEDETTTAKKDDDDDDDDDINPDVPVVTDENGSTISDKDLEQTVSDTLNLMENESVFSYRYDPSEDFFYTDNDTAWQHDYGFNETYDWAAPLVVMYYDTVRAKFNYDNEDWMIQMWKGQYGWVFIGSEVGVYYKPEDRADEHYDCADDDHMLKMEMSLYRDDIKLFTRKYADYWWVTGFVGGYLDKFSDRSELAVKARVTCKDAEMARLFGEALGDCGFDRATTVSMSNPDTYVVNGDDVYFVWQYIE